jgi:CBS domain-containing protein
MNHLQLLDYGWGLSATATVPANDDSKPLVGHWMTSPARVIASATPLLDAYHMMMRWGIRRLPVVDGEQLVGIVTLGDLREARPATTGSFSIYELNYQLSKLTVEQVMTHHPITVHPETPIPDAARLMLEHKIGGLPVVDATNKAVGIITESDLFRVLIAQLDR